eukprot:3978510-Pyramimonas_sp.AAC.1
MGYWSSECSERAHLTELRGRAILCLGFTVAPAPCFGPRCVWLHYAPPDKPYAPEHQIGKNSFNGLFYVMNIPD